MWMIHDRVILLLRLVTCESHVSLEKNVSVEDQGIVYMR